MRDTRRGFLATMTVCGSVLAAGPLLAAQEQDRPRGMPNPPPPAEPRDQDKNSPGPDPAAIRKAQLAKNEKDFLDGVERLYELTGELRDEVQKTTSTEIFSVRIYKKTEEIEKLAKQLKGKVKG